jgi:hypothetical protein
MHNYLKILCLFFFFIFLSCNLKHDKTVKILPELRTVHKIIKDTVIVDCHYTFEEAIRGTKAPDEIINQLELFDVLYYSTDSKLHKGQILTNKKLVVDLKTVFNEMYDEKFVVAHAIPIVKYDWDDNVSMQDNNSYSFCYRNSSFSKHAIGMAIDINPYFNPVCWKGNLENRISKPIGARHDTTVNGTFYSTHPILKEFRRLGFRWGHNFTAKFDDHHFEK